MLGNVLVKILRLIGVFVALRRPAVCIKNQARKKNLVLTDCVRDGVCYKTLERNSAESVKPDITIVFHRIIFFHPYVGIPNCPCPLSNRYSVKLHIAAVRAELS